MHNEGDWIYYGPEDLPDPPITMEGDEVMPVGQWFPIRIFGAKLYVSSTPYRRKRPPPENPHFL